MIHIYLAAPFSSKKKLKEYAKLISEHNENILIVSQWVYSKEKEEAYFPIEAVQNLRDIRKCDIFIQFSRLEQERSKGGMHVELGYALAEEKTCIIFGQRFNLFHWHPAILHIPILSQLFEYLKGYPYESK